MPSRAGSFVLYAVLRSFLAVGGRLPLAVSRSIGRALGSATFRLLPRSRGRIVNHLELAFPELDGSRCREIARGCATHFGLMLAEVAWLWHVQTSDVEKLCQLEGLEHIQSALDDKRGAMLATAHCGNWELLAARLPIAGVPLMSAVRELDDPRLDRLVTAIRTRFGIQIVPRGPAAGRQLARMLARNGVGGLLIDQDIRDVPGVFVPFFGRPAWTPSGAALLSIRMRCPMVPGFIHRRADGTHLAEIHPPLPEPAAGSLEDRVAELTALATAAIERQVRAHPEQWVWMHRRWRTQPESSER